MTVHFFAAARDLAGQAEWVCHQMATVGDLRLHLVEQFPKLQSLISRCSIAVNHEFADDTVRLSHEDEIAVLPPVSGG